MKITNLGVGSASVPFNAPVAASGADSAETVAAGAPSASNAYQPSAELQRLISLARAEPEIRTDRVQAALARLQQGVYHQAATIERTANAMIAGD